MDLKFIILLCSALFCLKEIDACGQQVEDIEFNLHPRINDGQNRIRREVSLANRSNCADGETTPVRVDTSQRVSEVIALMKERNLDAYIVPTADEHQSEYVSGYDDRRGYITGFTGSAGTAIILSTGQRALWTDGRYFLAADDQLDCNWIMMKQSVPGVPKILEWLKKTLKLNNIVGIDPKLIGAQKWKEYEDSLKESGIRFEPVKDNLVDLVWPMAERPAKSEEPIEILELEYAGKRWQDKVSEIREEMREKSIDMVVVTALDEVAWLFNLRGHDIPHLPVFRGYAIIENEKVHLFVDKKIGPEVDLHLHVNQCEQECVEVHNYKSIIETLRGITSVEHVKKVYLAAKIAYDGGASYAIVSAVSPEKRSIEISPLMWMKARKNPIERKGMRNAHKKDAVALIDFLSLLDEQIPAGKHWDELSASAKVAQLRAEQDLNKGISFTTISAFGSNGAIIHYHPVESTNKKITDQSLYLLDSGGQYKDGTTDVTRTLHYGTPTDFQIETYTRVLKGAVDIASLVFPEGTSDTSVDVIARRSLYEAGLDYRHGTGHGIGMYLYIHESPIQMRIYAKEGHKLEVGNFFSDEPGYYKAGEFGIRLETILTVVPAKTKYESFVPMLGFEPVTLVPFERKLIDVSLLSRKQCAFINAYHESVNRIISPLLKSQDRNRALKYLSAKTEPLDCNSAGSQYAMGSIATEAIQQRTPSHATTPIQFSIATNLLILALLILFR